MQTERVGEAAQRQWKAEAWLPETPEESERRNQGAKKMNERLKREKERAKREAAEAEERARNVLAEAEERAKREAAEAEKRAKEWEAFQQRVNEEIQRTTERFATLGRAIYAILTGGAVLVPVLVLGIRKAQKWFKDANEDTRVERPNLMATHNEWQRYMQSELDRVRYA